VLEGGGISRRVVERLLVRAIASMIDLMDLRTVIELLSLYWLIIK